MSGNALDILAGKLAEWEGEVKRDGKHVVYDDATGQPYIEGDTIQGTLTIGFGHTGDDVIPGMTWTDAQSRKALKTDLKSATDSYDKLVTRDDLNGNQKAAVLSLIFNVGETAFAKSKALKHLNKGNDAGFRKEAFDPQIGFVRAQNEINEGLVKRRGFEEQLFSTPVPRPEKEADPIFNGDEVFATKAFLPPKPEINLAPVDLPASVMDVTGAVADPREGSGPYPAEVLQNIQPLPNAPISPEGDTQFAAVQVSDQTFTPEPKVAPVATPRPAPLAEQLGLSTTRVPVKLRRQLDLQPHTAFAEVAAQEEEATRVRPSLWEATKAAGRQYNTTSSFFEFEQEFPLDLNFKATEWVKSEGIKQRIEALAHGDTEEILSAIGESTSAPMAEMRLAEIEGDAKDMQTITDAGIKALLPTLLVSVLDPVDIGITLATLPISGGASAALKFGRMGKIMTGAISAATATGTTEAVLASNSAFMDETDVAFATLAGFTLGGLFSSLSKADNASLQSIVDDVAKGEIDAAASKLGLDAAGAQRVAQESDVPNKNLAGKVADDVDELLDDIEDPKFRFKYMATLMANFQRHTFFSQSERVRKFSSRMLEGGFLKDKTKTRAMTAEGRANLIRRTYEAGIFRESLGDFKAWAKRNGHGDARRLFSTSTGEEFYSEVGMAMRGLTDGLSSEAISAAAKMRPFVDNMFALAEHAGVKGFGKDQLEDYFPRMINQENFSRLVREVGADGMAKFYREAILAANDDITESIAEKIAKGYVRTMTNKSIGIETDLLHGIRLDDVDKLRELFEGYEGIDALISEIEHLKIKETGERGTVEFSKRRIRFDEAYEGVVRGFDGERRALKFTDLLENDARKVLKRYGQLMSGHIGMAQELGIKSRGDFDDFLTTVRGEVLEKGHDAGKAQLETKALQDAYNLVLGQTIEANPGGAASKASRMATGFTYSTRGGQFGVNALAEAGNIIGQAGVRAFLRSIPEWKSMMKRAADGTLDHDLARVTELLFAPGIQTLTGHAIRNLDELGESMAGGATALDRAARASDPYLKSAGRATGILSGLSGITDITQRIAGVEYLRKLSRFAQGKKMSAGQTARLRAAGINEEMQERIFEMFRQASVLRKGRMVDLDVQKWTDLDALDALSVSSNRVVRETIQENDISNATSLFHHPAGRIIFQFLRFPMEAVNKQLLRSIHHADMEAAKSALASLFIGTTVYAAQTSIEFANDDKERKERLSPGNLARVGFMRTGISSMIPVAVDVLGHPLGMDAQFAKGRSSGLGTNVLTGNPVVRTGAALYGGASAIGRSLLSDEIQFAQKDVRDLASVIPGYRLLGIKNAIHAIEQAFPETKAQK